MTQINILGSFSSVEASISQIFAIKNCYFLALIFREQSEKLLEKTACDVNVGQVEKSGKFKTEFFELTLRRSGGSPLDWTLLASQITNIIINKILNVEVLALICGQKKS